MTKLLVDEPVRTDENLSRKPRRKRVVIVGGGFAGTSAASVLKRQDADVLLIDRRNHYIFQPLLYQVATAILSSAEISTPLRQLEARQRNLSVLLAEVIGIDVANQTVEAVSPGLGPRKFVYDFLVLATGMRPSYFGHDEFAMHAPGLKSLNDAETIRTKILSALETAEATDDESERSRQMTFVLVGAGPTGVELAASIAHLASVTLRRNFRKINPSESRIILLDGGDRILPTFADPLSQKVAKRLKKIGVEVFTGTRVEQVDETGVIASGKRIPSATVLWTAGVAASPLVKAVASKVDRAGRAMVDGYMGVAESPNVYFAGDATAMTQDGHPVPGVAQAAIQQGRFIGRLIGNRLKGRQQGKPFRYNNKGNMAVVGKNFAILEAGRLRMSGRLTWFVWAILHVLALPQPQNRLRVQTQWLWSYLSGQRSSRLISEASRPTDLRK